MFVNPDHQSIVVYIIVMMSSYTLIKYKYNLPRLRCEIAEPHNVTEFVQPNFPLQFDNFYKPFIRALEITN